MIVFNSILIFCAAVVLLPIMVFCGECLLSIVLRHGKPSIAVDTQPRVAVLIPAHDEAAVIGDTLATLIPTLRAGDRVLVVADNCTDDTAAVARTIGADVVERRDSNQRGKAYALEFGIQAFGTDPPDVVVVLDADCTVDADLVSRITNLAYTRNRPVQCRNLSVADKEAGGTHSISELGFHFKNLVRPLGMARLSFPCHLMGTGMAIPWEILRSTPLAGDHLAEDMQFGMELALKGHPALLCPEVGITSRLPSGNDAFLSQRTRWEQGHIRTSLTQVPRLLAAGMMKRRLSLIALAFDLLVPPLSLLVVIWISSTIAMTLAGLCGASWLPAILLASGGSLMGLAVLSGWITFCRDSIPLKTLFAIPGYILRKLPIYFTYFVGRRQKEWVRTERDTCSLEAGISPHPPSPTTHEETPV